MISNRSVSDHDGPDVSTRVGFTLGLAPIASTRTDLMADVPLPNADAGRPEPEPDEAPIEVDPELRLEELGVEPGPHSPDTLLAKLALFTHPAIWPSVQLALVFHDALRLPDTVVAWLLAGDRRRIDRLLSRGRRRIKAFDLLERVAAGSAWPGQLAQIHRFIDSLLELAARVPRPDAERRSKLTQIAYQVSSYLAGHPLAGTPESQELRRRSRRQLEVLLYGQCFITAEHRAAS
jgi:hypothetical protein